jgi:hypothetical protein
VKGKIRTVKPLKRKDAKNAKKITNNIFNPSSDPVWTFSIALRYLCALCVKELFFESRRNSPKALITAASITTK